MKKIPLSRPYINHKEIAAVTEVINSGWYAHGPKNHEFEKMFAEYIGVKHAISVNSGTAALFLSLLGLNITGEVIVPSFTFVASANAIVTAGAKPVFVDINFDTGNISVEAIEKAITSKTQAIMCVHFAGQPCQLDKLKAICKKYKLFLIEDSAECIGAEFAGKKAGSFGDTGCFSFFPTKNITTGEGGMVVTNNDELNKKIRALLAHGIVKDTFERQKTTKPWQRSASYPGYNFRLSNILAAMGVEQMKKLKKMNDLRIKNAAYFNKKLANIKWLQTPAIDKKCTHVYQMYTIRVVNQDRDKVLNYLVANGIEASVHFDPPVHKQIYYSKTKFKRGNLANTEKLANTIITLPFYPAMTSSEIDYIAKIIKKYK